MKDEIKEIITEMQLRNGRYIMCKNEDISFSDEDYKAHLLLDYITNLQEDIKKYVDVVLCQRQTIDNLQEEKERLKELCDKYEEEHNTAFKLWKGKLKETMDETLIQKQHDRIKELEAINEEHRKLNGNLRTANNTLCEAEVFMYNQAKDYKTRNEKAIEYIKSNLDNTGWLEIGSQDVEVLLNILQGKSDE